MSLCHNEVTDKMPEPGAKEQGKPELASKVDEARDRAKVRILIRQRLRSVPPNARRQFSQF